MQTREITYNYETENGECEVAVQYTVSKYYPATRETPAENPEVDIVSVTLNGVEVELTEQEMYSLIAYIEEQDDFNDKDYFYSDEEE